MSIWNINYTSPHYFQNNPKTHKDLMSYLWWSELLKNVDDEIVDWWFDWVLLRAKDLLENDKKNDEKNDEKKLKEKIFQNPVNNIGAEAFFKIKKSLTDKHWSCSVCGFAYEHCHC